MELHINTKEGVLTLNELVGEGSFGWIYNGTDSTGKSIAMKIVSQ